MHVHPGNDWERMSEVNNLSVRPQRCQQANSRRTSLPTSSAQSVALPHDGQIERLVSCGRRAGRVPVLVAPHQS